MGPGLCCASMASVLIRGSTDATSHLHTVTQPESTDGDEADARNRRLEKPRPPALLLLFSLLQQDLLGGETAANSLWEGKQSKKNES